MILALLLQTTPLAPLPKGTGLPPQLQGEETRVMQTVNALFAGIAARDAAKIAETLRPEATATIASENPDGVRRIVHFTREALLARFTPGPERFEERLYDPAIEIDGDLAYVWGRYNFYIDGKLHHCGYDLFDLVREGGSWKVQNLSWSNRTQCEAGS